ncbi:cation:proton antiporter [Sandarakinorhabdus rubra]|uniref:cation:proton antiporter n=1 Tax=Sandarakinorhabdus rubra TaxID=2672568 RepID=UPI0013DAFA9E|nr:sodium:proton antiporter [Sandarakinorhabdus rubra]
MAGSISFFDVAAILILLAAVLGYANHRLLGLPSSVGLTMMGAVSALAVVGLGGLFPALGLQAMLEAFLGTIDFHETLMDGMLSFLLFAGALHVDWTHMKANRAAIFALATVGVLLSTALVGGGVWFLSGLLGVDMPLIWALVFGALISPTDPVAVMAILKRAAMPAPLQATVAGESLFNDGVGVVVFGILLGIAAGTAEPDLAEAGRHFLQEAGGGALFGGVIGWLAFRAMRSIDDYAVEVMISLAVVMAGYSFATVLHVSGPVAMAVAGLLIGNAGVASAMSDTTRDYLIKFWELIDEVLNAVLFLLIGLEVVLITGEPRFLLFGLALLPLVLLSRLASVSLPLLALSRRIDLGPMALPILVWGGLRGGISIALVLALPPSPQRTPLLAATFVIVLFSVIVQGGSMGGLARRLSARTAKNAEA